jgi:hypothetical protein
MKTKPISEIFNMTVADSGDIPDYEDGDIPFVTSTEVNNGIVKYVEPLEGDLVFTGPCVVISGLGFATVHTGKVLPKGNGGDSCTVLVPKSDLDLQSFFSFAACFNVLHRWRFSFGRKCGKSRVEVLAVPWPPPEIKQIWQEQRGLIQKSFSELDKTMSSKFTVPDTP